MSKGELRVTHDSSAKGLWQTGWGRIVAWVAAGLSVLLAWLYGWRLAQGLPAGNFPFLLSIYALLALVCERALATTPLVKAWRYRASMLLPLGVFYLQRILSHNLGGGDAGWWWGVAALVGATAGAMLSTALHEPFWEDNAPPTLALRQQVMANHTSWLGELEPEPFSKRLFDFLLAAAGLLVASPLWLLIVWILWLEDPGPLLFIKNSVGRGGTNFRQLKFRTMVYGAENTTGPVLAREKDTRALRVGRLLRKTALDELPQLLNILWGEMSFVGPRPQRTVLVSGYLRQMPEYAERHRVRPGLAGLAQVAGDYYLTPRQKLRFDRLYIQQRSLGFDIKLLSLAFLVTFWYRWQPGWNGRLPRWLLHPR